MYFIWYLIYVIISKHNQVLCIVIPCEVFNEKL